MEKLFMANLLPNGLHEKVMICSICYITKSRLDVQFVKKFPLEMVIGQQMEEKRYDQNNDHTPFTLNFPFNCYLSRISK